MAAKHIDALNDMFESHPSLSASLEDFESNEQASPALRVPSHHSGFEEDDSEAASNSEPPWSPTAWRRHEAGNAWFQHQPYLQNSPNIRSRGSITRSREESVKYESAVEDRDDFTLAANIPLPRGSISPIREKSTFLPVFPEGGKDHAQTFGTTKEVEGELPEAPNNCAPVLASHE